MTDRSQERRRIWFIGPFPPPLHGQSNYNVAMAAYLRTMGDVRLVNTGGASWRKLVSYIGAAWAVLWAGRRRDVIYISAPGQGSLWLFSSVVLALRCRRLSYFVHHHSYRPLRSGGMAAMRFVTWLGGRWQHHILLSDGMRRRFVDFYLGGNADAASTLSNAFLFYAAEHGEGRRDRPLTLGHMSVLAREKGVDVALDIFEELVRVGVDVRFVLAGPIRDATLVEPIAAVAARHPDRFEMLGRVEGDAKRQFYDAIDLFLLPSRLPDEAEPLVLLEAYAAGVDVMATGRGCIPERLIAPDRLLAGDSSVDSKTVMTVANAIARDWMATRRTCREHAAQLHADAQDEARSLFAAMRLVPVDIAISDSASIRGLR